MLSTFFHAVFYNPIYNILVFLVAILPGREVGLAVIVLTILIRLVLLPFSLSAARSQRAMRVLEPKLQAIKEQYKDKKDEQAAKTLELYREEKINPFAPVLTLFIQLPVLLALYWVFRFEPFTSLDTARLYAFTPIPHAISNSLFGIIPTASKSIVLAFLAGASQYLQAVLALSNAPKTQGQGMQADFTKAMNMQLRYVFPLLIGVIAYSTSAAIALYFLTSNIIGALQEQYVRRTFTQSS